MATQHSTTTIMNAALLAQGLDRIDETQLLDEHRVLVTNWPLIVEAELERGQYNFTRAEATLVGRSPGLYGYEDSYLLPGDALFVRRLWVKMGEERYDGFDWTQDDRRVYVNHDEGCIIEYVTAPDVYLWSASFCRGIQFKLEATLLRAIKEEGGEAQAMEQMAEMQLQDARTVSSKQRSATPAYKPGRIQQARFGMIHPRGR